MPHASLQGVEQVETPLAPTLGLTMMVKNEADFIVQTLNSTKPFIDHWTIVDTGEPLLAREAGSVRHCVSHRVKSRTKVELPHYVHSDRHASYAHTTGSTDNTAALIEETMRDVPGELFHEKFEDFSTSRNLVGGAVLSASRRCSHALEKRCRMSWSLPCGTARLQSRHAGVRTPTARNPASAADALQLGSSRVAVV